MAMEAPVFIDELEITEPVKSVTLPRRADGTPYTGARLLVRMQHLPVGYVFLTPDQLDQADVCRQVWAATGAKVNELRARAGLPALAALAVDGVPPEESLRDDLGDCPPVSVVIATRDRPQSLLVTLRSLAAMPYPDFEVFVVDNAPSSAATENAVRAEFGADPRFRYLRESRPGKSRALNRGIAQARGEIIAFTDDDVRVDPWWLHGILRGFRAAANVGCVGGLIATAEIENPAQLFFDIRADWSTFRDQRVYDLTENRGDSPLYPYASGGLGAAGANCALSRTALAELGGWDEALGPGTPCYGGEDMDIFIRVLLAGYRLVYEPAALLSHYHRSDTDALRKQMKSYGVGLTAAIAAILVKSPRARREIPGKVITGVLHVFTLRDRVSENETLPAGVMKSDIAGMLGGPWAYVKSRNKLRRAAARGAGRAGATML